MTSVMPQVVENKDGLYSLRKNSPQRRFARAL